MNSEQQEATDFIRLEQASQTLHCAAMTRTQDSVTANNLAVAEAIRVTSQAKATFWRRLGAGVVLVAVGLCAALVTLAVAFSF